MSLSYALRQRSIHMSEFTKDAEETDTGAIRQESNHIRKKEKKSMR